MRHVTLVIKTTQACNAACIYCSSWKEDYTEINMSEETLRALHVRLAEYAQEGDLEDVLFTWHGGEPLLMDNSFYYRALDLQEELLKPLGIKVGNIMQSNLLSLNEKKAEMLVKLLHFHDGQPSSVGTSFDPIPGIRVMKHGDYERRFREAVSVAQEYGIALGLVYTVHKYSVDRVKEIYDFLTSEFPDMTIRFNPLYHEGRALLPEGERYYITPREWGRFIVELHEIWDADDKKHTIEPFAALWDFHQGTGYSLDCEHSGSCSEHHLGIGTDGTVYCCCRGVDLARRPYGNLNSEKLASILMSPYRVQLHNRSIYLRMTVCRDCKWWRYCHGGCPVESDISYGDLFHPTSWCEGWERYFDTIFGSPREETPGSS